MCVTFLTVRTAFLTKETQERRTGGRGEGRERKGEGQREGWGREREGKLA